MFPRSLSLSLSRSPSPSASLFYKQRSSTKETRYYHCTKSVKTRSKRCINAPMEAYLQQERGIKPGSAQNYTIWPSLSLKFGGLGCDVTKDPKHKLPCTARTCIELEINLGQNDSFKILHNLIQRMNKPQFVPERERGSNLYTCC